MKTAALCDYLEELPDEDVESIYQETPTRILRAFNCSPAALRSVIEDRFPDAVPDNDDEDDEEEDGGEED